MRLHTAIPLFVFLILSISPAYAANALIYAGSDGTWATNNPSVTGVVRNSTPTENLNSWTWIQVGNFSTQQYVSYIMFNLTSLSGANITNANLSLFDYAGATSFQILAFNSSLNWNRTNITWNNKPNTSIFQSSANTFAIIPDPVHYVGPHNIYFNVTNAVASAISSGSNYVSIALVGNASYQSQFYRYGVTPFLNVTYTASGGCSNPVIGSYCTADKTGIITSSSYSCDNNTIFMCPSGEKCSQISAQENTTMVIDDIVDCSQCDLITVTVGLINPHNVTFSPTCGWRVSQAYIDSCNCGQWYCSKHIYYGGQSNTTFNIEEWTAGCWNNVTKDFDIVINSTGHNTSIENITQQYCPNCTLTPPSNQHLCPANTSSMCYDSNCSVVPCGTPAATCSSGAGSFALSLGSAFGISDCSTSEWIFSMITSLMIGFIAMYYTRDSQHSGQAFIVGMLAPLVMFALIGWFPGWAMIILIVLCAYLIAKSLGIGN